MTVKKEVAKKSVVTFDAKKIEIDKEKMFSDPEQAKQRRIFLKNKFTQHLLDYKFEEAKAVKELLTDIKITMEKLNKGYKFE